MADLLMKMPIPYEPKRENRWILRFPSSLGINEWYVETFARPKLTIGATEIQSRNQMVLPAPFTQYLGTSKLSSVNCSTGFKSGMNLPRMLTGSFRNAVSSQMRCIIARSV
jgi:hypothetical protein